MSNERKLWSKRDVSTLISEWKLYPQLWDIKNACYRNRTKKRSAMQELAAKFDTNTNEIYRKMHNLRSQFHSELRRIESKKYGDGTNDTYRSTWEFFDAVKFISFGHSTPTTSMENKNKKNKNNSHTIHKDNRESSQENKTGESTKRNETRYDDLLLQTVKIMNKPADDFQIFGDYVASELRNLKSAENQLQLKLSIKRAILQFSEIDANGSSSISSYSSFSPSGSQTLSVSSSISEFTLDEERP